MKLFIGFGFPYEGPAPLEAIANGCIYLQPKFDPPHSSLNHEFFRGKPTSRKVCALRLSSFLPGSDTKCLKIAPACVTSHIDFGCDKMQTAKVAEVNRILTLLKNTESRTTCFSFRS